MKLWLDQSPNHLQASAADWRPVGLILQGLGWNAAETTTSLTPGTAVLSAAYSRGKNGWV